jgi:hypothetical protein
MNASIAALAAPLIAALAASSNPAPPAPSEIQMADASSGAFASKAEAEAFLSRAVPAATAANPKYRSANGDVETRWLTKTISFRQSESGGTIVSTDEEIEDYRNRSQTSKGSHQAAFAIDDVEISLETSAQDTTDAGEKARGVIFRCVGAPCIKAVWNGKPSTSSSTDIYLNDPSERERIFQAFRALQTKVDSQ